MTVSNQKRNHSFEEWIVHNKFIFLKCYLDNDKKKQRSQPNLGKILTILRKKEKVHSEMLWFFFSLKTIPIQWSTLTSHTTQDIILVEWEYFFLENVLFCTKHSQWEEIWNNPRKVTPQVNCPCCWKVASAEYDGVWINCSLINHISFFSLFKFCNRSNMSNTRLPTCFFFVYFLNSAHSMSHKSSEFLIAGTKLSSTWDQLPSPCRL